MHIVLGTLLLIGGVYGAWRLYRTEYTYTPDDDPLLANWRGVVCALAAMGGLLLLVQGITGG